MPTKTESLSEFSINGSQYRVHGNGVIEQINPEPYVYDRNYIRARYETYPVETQAAVAHLRLGLIIGTTGEHLAHRRILDWGYGNGAFLKAAREWCGFIPFGHEINEWPIPKGCISCTSPLRESWDVVTFFDVLEHIPNAPEVIANLCTEWLVISLPWCPYSPLMDNRIAFLKWKHRRPNEHLWHFSSPALYNFLEERGFKVTYLSNPEDVVRTGSGLGPNILTVVAKKV